MVSSLKIFILKNGNVCQELKSLLNGNEPAYSYINEFYSLRFLGSLNICGHDSSNETYEFNDVHCTTFAHTKSVIGLARLYIDLWHHLKCISPDLVIVLHPWELLIISYAWTRITGRIFIPCLPKPPISAQMSMVRKLLARHIIMPILRKMPIILARSGYIKDQLREWGINESNIIVYMPPYTDEFFSCGQLLQVKPNEFNIIFIGRLVKLKGVYDLLEIFYRVHKVITHSRLYIVGDGPEYASLKERCEAMGISGSVIFIGEVPQRDVYGYLGPADLVVLPSYQEGLGKTALEAFISGVPVLATSSTGFTQFIRHGINGYLYQPGDIDKFASKIIELCNDNKLLLCIKKQAENTGHELLQGNATFSSYISWYISSHLMKCS